jgi:hypothetical protein
MVIVDKWESRGKMHDKTEEALSHHGGQSESYRNAASTTPARGACPTRAILLGQPRSNSTRSDGMPVREAEVHGLHRARDWMRTSASPALPGSERRQVTPLVSLEVGGGITPEKGVFSSQSRAIAEGSPCRKGKVRSSWRVRPMDASCRTSHAFEMMVASGPQPPLIDVITSQNPTSEPVRTYSKL